MLSTVVWLVFVLGSPVALLTWLVTDRIFEQRVLDRDASMEEIGSLRRRSLDDPLLVGAFRYGWGFYGVAALWTLLVSELLDLGALVLDPPDPSVLLAGFPGGLISMLVENQVDHFVTAFLWWSWWGDGAVLSSLLVGWLGFRAGAEFARRVSVQSLLGRLRRLHGD